MAQRAGRRGRTKNLTCEICHEIFRHPKILSCFHTFCLHCLGDLAVDGDPPSFPCPMCRRTIEIPPEGVQAFTDNPFITEEELERERLWDANLLCSVHTDEELKYFCKNADCNHPICLSCSVTEHRLHDTEDISTTANRSKQKLLQELERLEFCIHTVSKTSHLAQGSVRAAQNKRQLLEEQVRSRLRALVAKVTELHNKVLEGLADLSNSVDQELSDEVRRTEEALDFLLTLQKRVTNAVNGRANEVEVIAVDKEMRTGEGSVSALQTLTDSRPPETVRPGLLSFTGNLRESLEKDVLLYFGSPVKLYVPNRDSLDVIKRFYCCESNKTIPEIHSIYCTDDGDIHVAFAGNPPAFADERVVHLDPTGRKIREHYVGRKITFDKSYRAFTYSPERPFYCDDIQANSNGEFRLKTFLRRPRQKTVIERKIRGDGNTRAVKFEINAASKPCGFDADSDGSLFLVINEEETTEPTEGVFWQEDRSLPSKPVADQGEGRKMVVRTVRLYRRNFSNHVDTYKSPLHHFFPTAVTFWKTERQELILIADSTNDCVHVARVNKGEFQFLRYLQASGCGDIVRPTALDVDKGGKIWIGCETGWLLQCEPFTSDIPDTEQNEGLTMMLLGIQNPSLTSASDTS
ncbi:uncharacterized protein LOC143292015 [Babylonia areolata]|uniref:uncharacterized protein LOC143292015 n=1 Tax=Babylonia areolata TaxID=304850 RepID=UPI003FD61C97